MNDIVNKYADKVTPEWRLAMSSIGLAYNVLNTQRDKYEQFLKAKQDMDSYGGLLDPTLYLDMLRSQGFKQQVKLVEASLEFLRTVEPIINELPAE